jgi:hypothetical protein
VLALGACVWLLLIALTPWLVRDVPTWACEATLIVAATALGILIGLYLGAGRDHRVLAVSLGAVAVGLELTLLVR